MALLSACGQQAPSAPQPAQSGPAPQPAAPAAPVAAKAPEAAKPAAGTAKEGGSFRFYLHTENAPTLDPYLNVSFRSQEFAAYFYSRLLMSKKGPGIPAQAYIMEGAPAETWKVGDDGKTYT